jgi:hypothetical protein
MLEQAIIDAQSLREAALKNAEAEVVQKYSQEVKDGVSRILEQEEDPMLGDATEEAEEVDSTAMEQVPMAHLPAEEDIVEVDLDDIISAAQDDPDEESFELDKEEIADEIGISLDSSDEQPPANRDDSINIDEEELVSLFKELLVVDIPKEEQESSIHLEAEEEEEALQDEDVTLDRLEGMDKKDIEEYAKLEAQNEDLRKKNTQLRDVLRTLKETLEEVSTQNARLLYTNRVYENSSLNERQKNKIVEMISKARSVNEAKVIFETLQKTVASTIQRTAPQSLSEAVTKRSSVILGGRQETNASQKNPTTDRWAILAGIKNTD